MCSTHVESVLARENDDGFEFGAPRRTPLCTRAVCFLRRRNATKSKKKKNSKKNSNGNSNPTRLRRRTFQYCAVCVERRSDRGYRVRSATNNR